MICKVYIIFFSIVFFFSFSDDGPIMAYDYKGNPIVPPPAYNYGEEFSLPPPHNSYF